MQNSFADKLRGNTATRKAKAALLLLFHFLRRQACSADEHPGSVAVAVCWVKEFLAIKKRLA